MLLSVMECIWEFIDQYLLPFKHSKHSLELLLSLEKNLGKTFLVPRSTTRWPIEGSTALFDQWPMRKRSAAKAMAHQWGCDGPSMAHG